MALLWTSPRQFTPNQVVTASQMNDISNNLSFLYTRPQTQVTQRGSGSNFTTNSTSFVDVDASLSITLETSGGVLEFNLLATFSNNTIATLTCFDIYMDNTTYMSSLTGTALTNGIWQVRETVAASIDSVKATPYRLVLGDVAAGVHTFVLRWRVSGGTSTLYNTAGNMVQFSVRESA